MDYLQNDYTHTHTHKSRGGVKVSSDKISLNCLYPLERALTQWRNHDVCHQGRIGGVEYSKGLKKEKQE